MNPTLSSGEGKRGRGRLQLLLIIGVVLGPMLLASAMYRFGFAPESRSYDGVLIANGQDRAAIGVSATAPERRWELLVTAPQGCEAQCQQLVYLARQINTAWPAARAGHALASATALDEAYEQRLRREYPQLQRHTLDAAVYARNPEAPATPNCGSSTPRQSGAALRRRRRRQGDSRRPEIPAEDLADRLRHCAAALRSQTGRPKENPMARPGYRLALIATALAVVVVLLGAYTRLTHAGLGCPDWPGCYGFSPCP